MKRKKKQKMTLSEKRKRKISAKYKVGGGNSKYARKHTYCVKNDVWGFEVPEPKPWQKKIETAGHLVACDLLTERDFEKVTNKARKQFFREILKSNRA